MVRLLVGQFLATVEELITLSRMSEIHEVGCGEGELARFIVRMPGRRMTASDVSPEIIGVARARDRDGHVDFRVRDIYRLDPASDAAELIVCCEVLEHLEHPTWALGALSRVAEPYCLVSVPREPLWRCLNLARARYLGSLGNTPGHIQHWGVRSFVRLFSEYFDVVQVRTPLPWIVVLGKVRAAAVVNHRAGLGG